MYVVQDAPQRSDTLKSAWFQQGLNGDSEADRHGHRNRVYQCLMAYNHGLVHCTRHRIVCFAE